MGISYDAVTNEDKTFVILLMNGTICRLEFEHGIQWRKLESSVK